MNERKRIGAKPGPKRAFGCADFLKAVKSVRSFSTSAIAKEAGVHKSTVNRFKNDPANEDCINEAHKFLEGLTELEFTVDLQNLDRFHKVPIIAEWDYKMLQADVSAKKRRDWIGGLMHLCKYLNVHPSRLTLEEASRVNLMVRGLYRNDEPAPYGLNYARIRESIRGFFMRVHEVSPTTLNNAGVTKEALKGAGRNAGQKVDQETRKIFSVKLANAIDNYQIFLEVLNVCKFMFYTGARISALLEFSFKKNTFTFDRDMWGFTLIDKGRHGGTPAKKIFIAHALNELKGYFSDRFGIPVEDLERELPVKVDHLFPSFVNEKGTAKTSRLRKYIKSALIESGLPYKEFPPLHIWRHTFAQEFLSASGWNYELCASLGGWKTTHILKKHYGEIGQDPLIKGLREAMGITVEKEKRELRW